MNTSINIKYCLFIIIPLLLISFSVSDNKSEYNVPLSPFSIFTSDLVMDSKVVIVLGHVVNWGYTNKSLSLLMNYNNGLFNISDTMKSFCGSQKSIFTANIDEDNLPDIVAFYVDISSGNPIRFIRVFYNDNGSFNNYSDFDLNNSSSFQGSYFADINGDSYSDVVVISYSEKYWGYLLNDGQGNLSFPTDYDLIYSPTDIKSGKLNEDNYDDIVIGGADLTIKFSQGTSFQTLSFEEAVVDIEIADFDNDGDNDIIGFDNLYFGTEVTFFENTGNSTFYQHENWEFTPGCYYLTVSDYNNDSLPDLFFHANADNGMYFYYNLGGFEFDSPIFFPFTNYGEYSRISASADFDNNGYNDLVIVRSHGTQLPVGNVTMLFNDGLGNFVEDPITGSDTPNPELQTPNLVCYPNPFPDNISIKFNIPEPGNIKLTIYDILGKPVISPVERRTNGLAGTYIWNGLNKFNQQIQPGIYFVKIILDGKQQQVIKIIKS
ncbi:MAG: T9SS type A sorting domain-containing protein [Bacteroidales bacterium]